MDDLVDTFSPEETIFFRTSGVVYDSRSAYQHIQVVELPHHGRTLVLDGGIQSSELDDACYHEALVQSALLQVDDPGATSALILGGGEGATLREVLSHRTIERAIMVDLDQQVVEVCREHLPTLHRGAFDDPRATVRFEDAERHMRENDACYDVIVFDIVDPDDEGPATHLFEPPLFELLKSRLKPGGVMTMQYGAAFRPHLGTAARVIAAVRAVFPHVAVGQVFVPVYHGAWGIAMASDHPFDFDPTLLDRRIQERRATPLAAFDGASLAALFHMPAATRRAIFGE